MKYISQLIFERQMSMFGHVARFPPNDPALPIGFFPVATLWVGSGAGGDHLKRG